MLCPLFDNRYFVFAFDTYFKEIIFKKSLDYHKVGIMFAIYHRMITKRKCWAEPCIVQLCTTPTTHATLAMCHRQKSPEILQHYTIILPNTTPTTNTNKYYDTISGIMIYLIYMIYRSNTKLQEMKENIRKLKRVILSIQ